jgi:hypothetical protein
MELLGDETQVESRFNQFGDCANLDVDRCMVLLGDEAQVKAHFGAFGDSDMNPQGFVVDLSMRSVR